MSDVKAALSSSLRTVQPMGKNDSGWGHIQERVKNLFIEKWGLERMLVT